MMQVGTNQSTTYHSQPSLSTSGGQAGRSSSTSRQQQQQQQPQYDNEQLANIRPRLCVLRKWPHYDGYGVHLARNQHWLGLRIGDVEPNSPAESGGLLREDVVLAVNGHSVENDDFFVILSFIQHELEDDQIRFLVLDPHSADLARRNRLNIDENYRTCVRMETPTLTVSPEKLLYDQWRSTNAVDPTTAQNTINLGPTLSLNQQQKNTQRYQPPPPRDGRDDVYTFLPYSEPSTTELSEARLCSVRLRPGVDTIGISLQPDKAFGHIIKQVEPKSPADLAGIEKDDCIISLNDTPLLNAPYEDVLNTLKSSRNEPNLDFVVVNKYHLLKKRQNAASPANVSQDATSKYTDPSARSTAEVMPSSNIATRNNTTSIPPTQALEQLYNKYNNEQKSSFDDQTPSNRTKETTSTTGVTDRYPSKQQQQQQQQSGQIYQGVGPATADRSSWGASSGKSNEDLPAATSGDASVRSSSQDRRADTEDTKGRASSLEDSFKPLQVGITNPTASQQSGNASPNASTSPVIGDNQRTSRPTSASQPRDVSSSPSSAANRTQQKTSSSPTPPPPSSEPTKTTANLVNAVPIAPAQSSRDYEKESPQTVQSDTRLATMPISELPNNGYELHNIQLMQPTETSPVGLKLTKQQDPLQFIITAVAKGTKADLAGLKVDDWLIKIEDKDVRLTDFPEVSHQIRQLLTNAGLINMVIARKKTPSSSPSLKPANKQQTTPTSSIRSESISRQQGGSAPTSILTTDITRDTPDNSQVRFVPEKSTSPTAARAQRSPASNRGGNLNTSTGSLSVGLTNPISDDNATRSPRSQSRSPTREYTINQQQKTILTEQKSDEYDPNEIREVVLKEALGLDFNSFIPEGDSQVQTHFISNVQASSMADRAGLRDGDRILTVNGVDVTNSVHEDVRRMMQSKKPLQLTVVNDPKYIDLIENVKRGQASPENQATRSRLPIKTSSAGSGSDVNLRPQNSESPPPPTISEDLKKYTQTLFTDNDGPVYVKHCILKKDPSYNGYGLLLRYQNSLHLIDQVEEDSPAFNAGLREDDVILYVDKKNVEKMTHDDVKILIRTLSLSNTNIDLVLIKKSDVQRYRSFQQQNTIDWQSISPDLATTSTVQTEQQQQLSVTRASDDTTNPRKTSTASSGKQPAPAPPTSTSQTNLSPGTRLCILYPSVDRTAGFALRGKAPPPYIICQIEKDSPAEKAGLLLNDALLSINGKSVADKTYEETVKLIKEALQQKSVELLVRDQSSSSSATAPASSSKVQSNMGNQSSTNDQAKSSLSSADSQNFRNSDSFGNEPSHEGSNAVEQYQKQRNKELSYTLRLCHLHPTNGDGTQATTFGFELSEEPDYEYPIILRVEPQSSAEGAGLQSRDILLKINDRKTKGLGYDKVKKEIEKAKRDGRLEMLVVDQETYNYCQRTKKPMKEPEMKVKHIFPKSRSSASFHKLPIATSRDSIEQLHSSTTKNDDNPPSYSRSSVGYRLSTPRESDSENEDDKQQNPLRKDSSSASPSQPAPSTSQRGVNFQIETPSAAHSQAPNNLQQTPLKFFDPAQVKSNQSGSASSGGSTVPETSRSTPALNQTSTKDSKSSKAKALANPISSLLHKFGHSKSSKPDFENAPKATTSTKTRAPSPPTIRVGHNRLDVQRVSQSIDTAANDVTASGPVSSTIHDTVRSTVSTGSFDYLRGPRRCVLKVDRNKGLGFVLSATGDYDHTITAVEKHSAADISGLQVSDEVLEVDGIDVRNVKYEQVVEMLVSAMRTNDTIEMRVIDGNSREAYTSQSDINKPINPTGLLNSNNNNNNSTTITSANPSQRTNAASGDDLSDINSSIGPFDSVNQHKINTSYPNLPGQLRQFDHATNRILSGSVPTLATGITASPNVFSQTKSISTLSERGSMTKISDISTQDAPVARLCRVRKFATSPFYGFFLCGDPKKLGRVFISDVTKHSPAAVCGLRDGDRIVEINGTTIETLTYETILDKIKEHMARDDLELLVLDKKALHWYRERNFPISSRTLPTIVHMEPIINDGTLEAHSSEVPLTQTKMVGFADRRVSKTGL